ncbi:MAG: ParA family protein [Bacilli bacterium]|jgi:chromosome partitioning protein|nr:ParA family protein [Bacilli bacterium]MDD2681611.1 ParA family protein [Bacilli bacterium]MDD3120822.1 ParA family protein [Bacilli bacterium]MDD4063017.1 ParA family protein [Bacilli bacterium]MDD4481703.1 ParA family protein [Bacilli bacterium]
MSKIISIASQKGGVGKTTTAINLAAAIARNDFKVLLIDLDKKANAAVGLGFTREDVKKSSANLFFEDNIESCRYITKNKNLDIIPGSIKLNEVEKTIMCNGESIFMLHNKLENTAYDYIIIDCPPSLSLLVDVALYASDSVLIPTECEFFSYDDLIAMIQKINEIQTIKKKSKKTLVVEGILLTKFDNRNVFSYKIAEKVREMFPEKSFKTVINRSSHLQEAQYYGKDVISFAYNSRGSREYRKLALELLGLDKEKK